MDGTAAMEAGPKDGNCKCFVCGEEVAVAKMRDHVGCHIVANKLKIPEAIKPKLTVCGHSDVLLVSTGSGLLISCILAGWRLPMWLLWTDGHLLYQAA